MLYRSQTIPNTSDLMPPFWSDRRHLGAPKNGSTCFHQALGILACEEARDFKAHCLVDHQNERETPEEEDVHHKHVAKIACELGAVLWSPCYWFESVAVFAILRYHLDQFVATVRYAESL